MAAWGLKLGIENLSSILHIKTLKISRGKTMKDYDSVTVRDCDDKFAKEMFLDLRAELGDEEAMRQAVASYQIPNWIQASILESCRVQDFIGLDDSGNIYFVVYLENKTVITVIDLSPSARHERDQWETVNDEDFYDRNNAVDYARKLAEKYNLGYKPFDSRYDKSLNEQSNNHLSL